MFDEETVGAYLDRIRASPDRVAPLDRGALFHLQERHVLSVPFENLDYHSGDEIFMDERVADKVVRRGRGGGCYEINTSFYLLLVSLGFRVTLHQCRVWIGGSLSAPYNHVVMVAEVAGEEWLVDVGFGKNSRLPLALGELGSQHDPQGRFEVRRVPSEHAWEVHRSGVPQYRFYGDPVKLADFSQHLWWYRTSPESPFLRNLFCSLPTEDGRVTLTGSTLTVIGREGRRTETINDGADIIAAYERYFGIVLDAPPVPGEHWDNSMRMSFFADPFSS